MEGKHATQTNYCRQYCLRTSVKLKKRPIPPDASSALYIFFVIISPHGWHVIAAFSTQPLTCKTTLTISVRPSTEKTRDTIMNEQSIQSNRG